MAHRFRLSTRRGAGRVMPGQAASRAVDQEDARDPESGDQHGCRLEVCGEVRRRQLGAHDHDREHGDDEEPLEPEHERSSAGRQCLLFPDRDVEHDENDGLNRDPAQDVSHRDPDRVRERGRRGDRDLGQVRRDREQDDAADRFSQPQPLVQHVGRVGQVAACRPDRPGRDEEDQHQRREAEA